MNREAGSAESLMPSIEQSSYYNISLLLKASRASGADAADEHVWQTLNLTQGPSPDKTETTEHMSLLWVSVAILFSTGATAACDDGFPKGATGDCMLHWEALR
jgi:hypothetical protein